MKKLMSMLLSVFMLLCLCACSDKDGQNEPQPTQPVENDDPEIYTKEDGKLKMEVSYNSNGLLFSTIIYEYDGAGNVIKEAEFGINDAPAGYNSYEYDDKGRKTLLVSYMAVNDEEYSEEYRTSYEYDESGKLIKAVSTMDGKTVSVTEYEYKNGLCVSENNYEGESFVISEYKYEYDDSDRISRCVRIDHIEGDTTENRYTYTSDGLLLADLSYGTDGKVISRTEYSYDDKGNAVKLSVYNAMGEPMSSTSKEYTYDDLGNIKRCVVTHSDGSKGTTTEYKWEYSKG